MRRLACVLGHPVRHSVSPAMHDAAFAACGVDAVYLAFDVPPANLAEAIGGLRAVGFLGGNVTVPHKLAVAALCDRGTAEAEAVGAVNTLYWEGPALVGDNTDALGLGVVLDELGIGAGDACLLLGAGGAAGAAGVALGRRSAAVTVAARRVEAAEAVAARADANGASGTDIVAWVGGADDYRLVVNATSVGLHGEELPAAYTRLGPGQTALDLIYRPTPFLAAAEARGAEAVDGLGMLVAQAGLSFERWTGVTAPVEVMRAAARGALK